MQYQNTKGQTVLAVQLLDDDENFHNVQEWQLETGADLIIGWDGSLEINIKRKFHKVKPQQWLVHFLHDGSFQRLEDVEFHQTFKDIEQCR